MPGHYSGSSVPLVPLVARREEEGEDGLPRMSSKIFNIRTAANFGTEYDDLDMDNVFSSAFRANNIHHKDLMSPLTPDILSRRWRCRPRNVAKKGDRLIATSIMLNGPGK